MYCLGFKLLIGSYRGWNPPRWYPRESWGRITLSPYLPTLGPTVTTQALPRQELQVGVTPQSSPRPRSTHTWEIQICGLHQTSSTPQSLETQVIFNICSNHIEDNKDLSNIYFTQCNSHCFI